MVRRDTVAVHFVIVSGWTGSGKSTIADAIGSSLPATVLSFDWLMSALRVFPNVWATVELPVEHQRAVGWSLLGRGAEQQLRRGGSVVVDLVARQPIVDDWVALAARYRAHLTIVACVCSDEALHQSRVDGRARAIPGWYELAWPQVERGRRNYVPLKGSQARA